MSFGHAVGRLSPCRQASEHTHFPVKSDHPIEDRCRCESGQCLLVSAMRSYYAPITQLCGCGIASNRSAHAEHGQKRCLATGNPAHPEESLNLGPNNNRGTVAAKAIPGL